MKTKRLSVILHNIRSAHNVGAIFRTADSAGVEYVYLTGYTPQPIDRFGRVQSEIQKTSLGATESVPWSHHNDVFKLIATLQVKGVAAVAVEQHLIATPLFSHVSKRCTAYIFGNETDGLDEEVCAIADDIVEIPMYGTKESLNVSVAAGIVLYHTPPRGEP